MTQQIVKNKIMSSINRTKNKSSSPHSSNSNGSIHEDIPSSALKNNNPKWSFHTPIPSTSLPRDIFQEQSLFRHNSNDNARFDSTSTAANKRISVFSTYSSSASSDQYSYSNSQRNSSIYTYNQAGLITEQDNINRNQNRNQSTFITSTQVRNSSAQEAPAPLFDPFILMDRKIEPRTYNLIIRQSPMHGQMCTLGSKERRILDPLPIVQLDIRDKNGNRDIIGQSSPLLIMQVNLIAEQIEVGNSGKSSERNESGSSNSPIETRQYHSPISTSLQSTDRVGLPGFASVVDTINDQPTSLSSRSELESQLLPKPHETHFSALRLLEGKLTASPHIVRDIENHLSESRTGSDSQSPKRQKRERDEEILNLKRRSSMPIPLHKSKEIISEDQQEDQKACFFIFTDLSIRLRGIYRLQFSLIKLGLSSSAATSIKSAGEIVARTISDPFPIHHSRDFAGMTESTPLAKSLAFQGVHIPIRNDSRWKGGRLQNVIQQGNQKTNTTSSTDDSPSSTTLTPSRSSSTPQSNIKLQ